MAFYVGQKVVRLEPPSMEDMFAEYPILRTLAFPETGKIYTIRGFHRCLGSERIWLEEINNPPILFRYIGMSEVSFDPRYFRPIVERKTSIEIFERMLNPSKQEVSA